MYKTMNLQIEKLKNIEYNLHFYGYMFMSFFIPLLLGHPQILVGVIVNAALILGAMYLDFKGVLPVIILPSLGVLSRGLIFGPFTVYLIYMIPFIWIGNAILVYCMKYFHLKRKKNYALSLGISAAFKTAFLFSSAFVMVKLELIPVVFLTAMGILQLATAIGGGIAGYGVVRLRNKIC